jgi:hypothetical protein
VFLALVACGKSAPTSKESPPPTPAPAEPKPSPAPAQLDDPRTMTPHSDGVVPVNTWVRTTGYDGKPFLGFTYMDSVKGLSMKGEFTTGLSDEELSKKLQGFPDDSFEPYPDGHPATPLTADEIKRLKLPNPPNWVSSYH